MKPVSDFGDRKETEEPEKETDRKLEETLRGTRKRNLEELEKELKGTLEGKSGVKERTSKRIVGDSKSLRLVQRTRETDNSKKFGGAFFMYGT